MDDHNTLQDITTHIAALNKALGHRRGVPRVTLETATPEQQLLVIELAAWHEAEQYRLNMDSACARARLLADGAYRIEQTTGPEGTRYAIVDEEGERLDLRDSTGKISGWVPA